MQSLASTGFLAVPEFGLCGFCAKEAHVNNPDSAIHPNCNVLKLTNWPSIFCAKSIHTILFNVLVLSRGLLQEEPPLIYAQCAEIRGGL